MTELSSLDHPCRDTCSGWKQGRERGIFNVKRGLMKIVNRQAEDEGLWFDAETAPEAYLQNQLRILHEVIERIEVDKNGGQ